VDTLLVVVALLSTGQEKMVEALLSADSVLQVPSADVAALFGEPVSPAPYLSLKDLQHSYPALSIAWDVRALRLTVADPQRVLRASRDYYSGLERQARGAAPYAVTVSGPYMAFTGDDSARTALDVGYSWRGRLALQARRSNVSGTTWSVGLAPAPFLFATLSGVHALHGAHVTSATARLALGPLWLQPSWANGHASADALVALGPFALFASSRNAVVVTITGRSGALQLGRSARGTAARFSVGPALFASPFSIPTIY
jgi:hypothetical protein